MVIVLVFSLELMISLSLLTLHNMFSTECIFSVIALPLARRVAVGDRNEWLNALVLE